MTNKSLVNYKCIEILILLKVICKDNYKNEIERIFNCISYSI